jgi:hypothetical protein
MKDAFKEAAPRFNVLKKHILDYQQAVEKTRKLAENEAKKAVAAAAKTTRACGRSRGTRGGRRGGGRGTRGRGADVAEGSGAGVDDFDSKLSGMTQSSESGSDSDLESEAEILIPRSRQQHQIRVIQGCREDVPVQEENQEITAEDNRNQPTEQPQPGPCPQPHICHQPLEAQDVGEAEELQGKMAGEENGDGASQEGGGQEHASSPKIRTNLVPEVLGVDFETQERRIEVPLMVQSGKIENQVEPLRRQNPRRGKASDTPNT